MVLKLAHTAKYMLYTERIVLSTSSMDLHQIVMASMETST